MKSAVVDTNVLASGFVRRNPQAPPARLIDAWLNGAYILVLSEYILGELAEVFTLPYFARHLTAEQAAANIAALRSVAVLTAISTTVTGVASDPDDDAIVATAVSSKAGCLVTGDIKLQQLGSYEGVTLLSPRAFLDLLQAEETGTEAEQ